MNYAFSTNAFTRFTAEDAIAQIARAGYTGAELMFDKPHLFPAHATAAKVKDILRAAADVGITFSNGNAFPMSAVGDTWNPSWIDPDKNVRRARLEHTQKALRLAHDLGIANISTEPGGQLTLVRDRRESLEMFAEGLSRALETAEQTGVAILVEPEPHLLLEKSDEFLELMAMISHPLLALNFDIGHFYCAGEDPAESFRKLKEHVRHVHLEDIAKSRVHRHLAPGEGSIDLPAVVDAIRAEGYNGWITVELYPYQDNPFETAAAARKYIAERIER